MDAVAQLGRSAYHALCMALAAQHKDKLYAPETDVLLEEARELLGISEEEDEEIRSQIEKDPMVAALRRGELPPGGLRLPGAAPVATRSGAAAPSYGGMPPPGGAAPAGYDTPFGAAAAQSSAMQRMGTSNKKVKREEGLSPGPPPAPPAAASSPYVGRKLQRLFPDASPPWVTGTIVAFNPANNKHQIQYGPPLKTSIWENIDDWPPQNFRWVEPGQEAALGAAPKSAGPSKAGGGSKATTPKAPPPPAPKAPPTPKAPTLFLPGGPSTFHATGVSIATPPYSEAFFKGNLAKGRSEELFAMLAAMDERGGAVVREILALLEDPTDVADITRLLEQSAALGQREQQLRGELREMGVVG